MFVQLVLQVSRNAHSLSEQTVDLLDVVRRQRIFPSFLQLVKHHNLLLYQCHALFDLLPEAVYEGYRVELALALGSFMGFTMVNEAVVVELVSEGTFVHVSNRLQHVVVLHQRSSPLVIGLFFLHVQHFHVLVPPQRKLALPPPLTRQVVGAGDPILEVLLLHRHVQVGGSFLRGGSQLARLRILALQLYLADAPPRSLD
mmetsp:Transcript_28682/g.92529  ORF Transcript_28682/g.92529 Transcript_28682/m.92529 type:complete len:200 (-) Transcript_28682:1857-2456(-)